MTDLHALITELADELDHNRQCLLDDRRVTHPLADKARAVLARWGSCRGFLDSSTLQPADGEMAELVAWMRNQATVHEVAQTQWAKRFVRAASLLESLSPPQPIPVSERLPGVRDCAPWPGESDASAWCWVGSDVDGGWIWEQRSAGCLAVFPDDFTHWLPAHALPVPQ